VQEDAFAESVLRDQMVNISQYLVMMRVVGVV
jgi:hypothetical protein